MASESLAGDAQVVGVVTPDGGDRSDHLVPEIDLARIAADAACAKKGDRTVILEVGPLFGVTDYFVITAGANPRQVRTIAEEIERKVKESGGPGPASVEGFDDARWVLLDYGDFVCHVFLDEARDYYDIERLWSDAPRTEID